MIPDPVALGEFEEKREQELQIHLNDIQDLADPILRRLVPISSRLVQIGEFLDKNPASVVPYRVIFWIFLQKLRRLLKQLGCKVLCRNLSPFVSSFARATHFNASHLLVDFFHEVLILFDVSELFLPIFSRPLLPHRRPRHAMLKSPHQQNHSVRETIIICLHWPYRVINQMRTCIEPKVVAAKVRHMSVVKKAQKSGRNDVVDVAWPNGGRMRKAVFHSTSASSGSSSPLHLPHHSLYAGQYYFFTQGMPCFLHFS